MDELNEVDVTAHSLARVLHCKNIRISVDILWQVCAATFQQCGPGLFLFRRFTDTNVYGTGSVNI